MVTQNELLTTQEAAEFLGSTVGTLEVWRSSKRYPIPYIKVGRLVRYRRSDLLAWLESRTVSPSPVTA
jgi:excisionase family DNA binding protein